MSAIINFSINLEKIAEASTIKGKKGTYVNLTLFANDDTKFGNNASCIVALSKEERDANAERNYLGNGKVAYVSDSGVTVAEKEDAPATTSVETTDDLPF